MGEAKRRRDRGEEPRSVNFEINAPLEEVTAKLNRILRENPVPEHVTRAYRDRAAQEMGLPPERIVVDWKITETPTTDDEGHEGVSIAIGPVVSVLPLQSEPLL